MTPPADAAQTPVAVQAAHGHRSTLVAQAVRVGCKAVSVVVLARLLTPAEHGVFAMAASVFMFLFIFRDLGLGTAAVQAATLGEAQLSALFRAQVGLGLVLMVLAAAAAPVAAMFYGLFAVSPVLIMMAPAFLLMGVGAVPRALLARELRFRELNLVETTAAVVGTAAMLAAAAWDAGPMTFVVFQIVSETVSMALAWRACRWRPRAAPDWAGVRSLLGTGMELTGFHAVNYIYYQIDTFVVGRLLGAREIGLYNRTGQLLGLTNLHIAGPLTQVALAALARVRDEPWEFRRQAKATATLVAHLSLPVLAVCAAVPGDVVVLVLGPQWPEAAPMLRWLAVSMGVFTVTSLAYSINVAAGQTRRLAVGVAFSLPAIGGAVWLGLPDGAAGVARAVAVANVALAVPRLAWMLRGSPLSTRAYLDALVGPVMTAAVLTYTTHAAHHLCLEMPPTLRLLCEVALGVTCLGALLPWDRLRREWGEVIAHLPFTKPPSG